MNANKYTGQDTHTYRYTYFSNSSTKLMELISFRAGYVDLLEPNPVFSN